MDFEHSCQWLFESDTLNLILLIDVSLNDPLQLVPAQLFFESWSFTHLLHIEFEGNPLPGEQAHGGQVD